MRSLLFLSFLLAATAAAAQTVTDINEVRLEADGPVSVKRLAGDSLTTSFLIRVDGRVPTHYHARHSEHVYIIEGSGKMWMNGDTTEISAGNYVFIPAKTRHGAASTSGKPLKVLSIQAPEFNGEDRVPVK